MKRTVNNLHSVLSEFVNSHPNISPDLLDLIKYTLGGLRPIPTNSRLPTNNDLDKLGRCWCHQEVLNNELNRWEYRRIKPTDSHWMPFWAISNLP